MNIGQPKTCKREQTGVTNEKHLHGEKSQGSAVLGQSKIEIKKKKIKAGSLDGAEHSCRDHPSDTPLSTLKKHI